MHVSSGKVGRPNILQQAKTKINRNGLTTKRVLASKLSEPLATLFLINMSLCVVILNSMAVAPGSRETSIYLAQNIYLLAFFLLGFQRFVSMHFQYNSSPFPLLVGYVFQVPSGCLTTWVAVNAVHMLFLYLQTHDKVYYRNRGLGLTVINDIKIEQPQYYTTNLGVRQHRDGQINAVHVQSAQP